jgi:hypothetical protein
MAEILPVLDALLAATRRDADRSDPSARSAALALPAWAVEPAIEDESPLDRALDAPA